MGFEIYLNNRICKYNKNTLKIVLKYYRRRKTIGLSIVFFKFSAHAQEVRTS